MTKLSQGWLSADLENAILEHARREAPKECCGYVVGDEYIPVTNVAENPEIEFRVEAKEAAPLLASGRVRTFVHSHPGGPFGPSKLDMEKQLQTRLPWTLAVIDKLGVGYVMSWGAGVPKLPLIGRPFVHGIWDCYECVRDHFAPKGIVLPPWPRSHLWWAKGDNLYADNFATYGFVPVALRDLRADDVILMQYDAPVLNHAAVYLGDGRILHHLADKLSAREPAEVYTSFIKAGTAIRYAK